MSSWPPNPNQGSNPNPSTPRPENSSGNRPTGIEGKEWQLLEKALLASVEEQRRARRWGIFFKLIAVGYFLVIFALMSKGCQQVKEGKEGLGASSRSHLAVVDVTGAIGMGDGANSEDIIDALDNAFEAKNSKAVVLNINSPGGSPVQSDDIWQEIRRLRSEHTDKKVYAVIGDIGASGAYYIASAADEIYVNPSSLVGSIGVIMPNYGLQGLAQKLGVEDRTMTSGEHKAILSMTKPIDPAEKAHVQGVLDAVHAHFIKAVRDGRGKRLKETPDTFSGLFWSGDQAVAQGIADKFGSVASLQRELKLDDSVNYSITHSPLESLLGKVGTSMGHGLGESLAAKVDMSTLLKQSRSPLQ